MKIKTHHILLAMSLFCGAIAGCGQDNPIGLEDANANVALTMDAAGKCSMSDRIYYIHNPNPGFINKVSQCGNDTWGDAGGTANCLVNAYPRLSSTCASCFGNVVSCTKDKCFTSCLMSQTSSGCIDCTNQNCTPALSACTGVPVSQLPANLPH